MKSKKEPPYIVFEGVNGCGKTTLAAALVAEMRDRGLPVAHLAMPGPISRAGQLILDVFNERVSFTSEAMLWLFAAELADLTPQITAMRNDGVMIVGDRHTMFSAFVYQMPIHGRVVVEAALRHVKPVAPTHVYVIDVPAHVALERQDKRHRARRPLYEPAEVEKVDQLRKAYQWIPYWPEPPSFWPGNEKVVVLDGLQPIEENTKRVLNDVDVFLGRKGDG